MGLSKGISQEKFDFYRAAELKNGRVAMLAVAGYVNAEIWRFPGEIAPGLKFADVPNGIKALDAIPALGWMQMFFLIGAVDYYGYFQYPNNVPDLAPEEMERRKLSELTYVISNHSVHCICFRSSISQTCVRFLCSHGRLAMLAFVELIRHDAHNIVNPGMDGGYMELITGFPFLYNDALWGDIPH